MSTKSTYKSICVDANFLVALLDSRGAKFGKDVPERIAFFLAAIDAAKAKVIVPTPAIAEYLVGADQAGLESLNKFRSKTFVEIAAFDLASAHECALIDRSALGGKDKKDGSGDAWQKIKVDRQILAIARAKGCTLMVTQDKTLAENCKRVFMEVLTLNALPLPPQLAQKELPLTKRPRARKDKNI